MFIELHARSAFSFLEGESVDVDAAFRCWSRVAAGIKTFAYACFDDVEGAYD
jgi:hypothetical protein